MVRPLVWVLLVGLLGCGGEPEPEVVASGLIEASEQRPGDARAGRHALLNGAYVTCGVPADAIRAAGSAGITVDRGEDGRGAELPYSMNLITTEAGVELATGNCLTCHAAPLFGELVVGLGNEFLDFTGDASSAVEDLGVLVRGEAEIVEWERYADRMQLLAPYLKTLTIGANPANNLTAALIAHRDADTNAWSDTPLLQPPPTPAPPVSVPPWWRMSKKHAMFNMGEGRGDHARIMMSAAMLCSDTRAALEAIDELAPDIRAYIASLQPPAYPFDIDSELAAQGETVFNATCSVCHGTYGAQTSYPNRLVPIETVGTDSTLIDYAYGDGQAHIEWFNRSFFGELSRAVPSRGYVAPPLDGIWATAPFLHNGSVPTVAALLQSTTRPRFWQHLAHDSLTPDDYDPVNLGWRHAVSSTGQLAESDALRRSRLYDTTLPGYSNAGHTFGDGLTDEDRQAVIEYLKTL